MPYIRKKDRKTAGYPQAIHNMWTVNKINCGNVDNFSESRYSEKKYYFTKYCIPPRVFKPRKSA
jgi:hypothetical protein